MVHIPSWGWGWRRAWRKASQSSGGSKGAGLRCDGGGCHGPSRWSSPGSGPPGGWRGPWRGARWRASGRVPRGLRFPVEGVQVVRVRPRLVFQGAALAFGQPHAPMLRERPRGSSYERGEAAKILQHKRPTPRPGLRRMRCVQTTAQPLPLPLPPEAGGWRGFPPSGAPPRESAPPPRGGGRPPPLPSSRPTPPGSAQGAKGERPRRSVQTRPPPPGGRGPGWPRGRGGGEALEVAHVPAPEEDGDPLGQALPLKELLLQGGVGPDQVFQDLAHGGPRKLQLAFPREVPEGGVKVDLGHTP